MPFVPIKQSGPVARPQQGGSPLVFTGSQGVVNLPGKAAEQRQSNAIDLEKEKEKMRLQFAQDLEKMKLEQDQKLKALEASIEVKKKEQETLNLPAESSQRFNQAVNVLRLSEQLRDGIKSGKNVVAAGVFDTEFKGLINNLNSNLTQLRSGAASSDKERAFLEKIGPIWQDVLFNMANGKATASQINKLSQIYAEAKGLATTIGGPNRLNDILKVQKDAQKEFIGDDSSPDIEQQLLQQAQSLQQRLNQLKGGR